MNDHAEQEMSTQPRHGSPSDFLLKKNGDALEKLVIAPPQQHGHTFFFPEIDRWHDLWRQNCELRGNRPIVEDMVALSDLPSLAVNRLRAREEMCRLATAYTARYQPSEAVVNPQRIILSGHQPTLFHPGVWFKNFLLSEFSQSISATAINIIVDNDLCTDNFIQVPHIELTERGELGIQLVDVDFDQQAAATPFEERLIVDQQRFDSFPHRVVDILGGLVRDPLINRWWSDVMQAQSDLSDRHGRCNLGQVVAAGRHRLEKKMGLQTLEVPLSHLVDTTSFSCFSLQILLNSDRFLAVHNQAVQAYRQLYRLRSRSHPVPELDQKGDWHETPFWVWDTSLSPVKRRPLFIRRRGNIMDNQIEIELGDGEQWICRLIGKANSQSLVKQIAMLNQQGIKIRPRAIVTTMYCRSILSDMFLHGVGGGKYDQITDSIVRQFWSVPVANFAVASISIKWLSSILEIRSDLTSIDSATRQDESLLWQSLIEFKEMGENDLPQLRQRLRYVDQHPDRVILEHDPQLSSASSDVKALIQQKRAILEGRIQFETTRAKHVAIAACNQQLQTWVAGDRERLLELVEHMPQRLAVLQSIDSRELSFCLFQDLILETFKTVLRSTIQHVRL